MRFSCLLILLLLCFWFVGALSTQPYARNRSVVGQTNSTEQEHPLRLTTSIISQRYCKGDAEIDVLQMDLRLCYTNIGKQPLILQKGSSDVFRVRVSRNTEDALSKRFEVDASVTRVTNGRGMNIEAPSPGKLFVILSPGMSFETQADAFVNVAHSGASGIKGVTLDDGEYVLQLRVSTWPASESLAEQLHKRWKRSGVLWFNDITSAPMRFKVEKNRSVVECP